MQSFIRLLPYAALALSVILYLYSYTVFPVATVVIASASLVFGVLGSLVAARRLYFLAGAAPHASLLAALVAVPLAFATGLPLSLLVAAIGVVLVYTVGYAIYRGVDPDTATSIFVSLAASLSVIMAYVVKSSYSLSFDVTAVVFGDPLLSSWSDAAQAATVAAFILAAAGVTYREQVYIGVDREAARLTGLRIWLYDLVFFTLLGLGVSVLVRSVGFVLEHVLVLVPGVIAGYAMSSSEAIIYAVAASFTAGGLGLALSLALNVSPAGATGFVLFLLYLLAAIVSRKR